MSPGGRLITIRQFAPLETIVREHERGETAFVIEKGKVEVTRIRDGKTVHIAFLEAGATFGEMGVVDDAPRSATVTAMEETLVREIHRDNIQGAMKESPDAIIKFLKNIFERLREANMRIAHLENAAKAETPAGNPALPQPNPFSPESASALLSASHGNAEGNLPQAMANGGGYQAAPVPAAKPAVYSIEGLTPQAIEAIPDNPFTFTTFPLKIGRKTNDPLVNNHLEIQDQDPLQISRHHVNIVRENGKLGVVDRGSQLGALVDDVRIGGKRNSPGPAFFKGDEGILILGTAASPYRYKIKRCAD
jgi:CRP/FNR family cyclic AMP-dependent transcriptional regulator